MQDSRRGRLAAPPPDQPDARPQEPYPTARDPRARGRQLEELAFEIASAESLVHAGAKAARLVSRP